MNTPDLTLPPLPTMEDGIDLVLDNDFVGVVVTSYNQPEYLAQTVQSVARQDWQHVRCVVVDDGSSDGGDVARAAVASLPDSARRRFQVLATANQGPSRARNTGFSAMPRNIKHVLFVDGDDILFPDALSTLREGLGDAPASAGCVLPITGAGELMPRGGWFPRWLPPRIGPDVFRDNWLLVTPGTTLYTRAALEAVGGWPDTLIGPDGEDLRGEDVMLACMVAHRCGPIAGVSQPMLYKREHGASFCQSDRGRLERASAAYREAVRVELGG